jgi:hypothetical protein
LADAVELFFPGVVPVVVVPVVVVPVVVVPVVVVVLPVTVDEPVGGVVSTVLPVCWEAGSVEPFGSPFPDSGGFGATVVDPAFSAVVPDAETFVFGSDTVVWFFLTRSVPEVVSVGPGAGGDCSSMFAVAVVIVLAEVEALVTAACTGAFESNGVGSPHGGVPQPT